jgi:hypothetical protein
MGSIIILENAKIVIWDANYAMGALWIIARVVTMGMLYIKIK